MTSIRTKYFFKERLNMNVPTAVCICCGTLVVGYLIYQAMEQDCNLEAEGEVDFYGVKFGGNLIFS